MLNRRTLLAASATLAAPAIVTRAHAQSKFDWKQCKGQSIEVNLAKSPRGDVLQKHRKEFEELTGISVGDEQMPEQQQRPKVALEMASGHPSFDVVNVAMHVQKRLIEKAKWMEDLRPYLADPTLTAPDFDHADFSDAGMKVVTGGDGRLNALPLNQDLFILYYNRQLLEAKGLTVPKTVDEMITTAEKVADKANGIYGFVGRGLKNANVVLYDNVLLGYDQETITADGRRLLTDTPKAVAAARMYQRMIRDLSPPGAIGFNWNECQTTFSQGRAAMWWDGIGFSAPLMDKTRSKIANVVGFAPPPGGPGGQWSCTFMDAIGIPAASKNKKAAWLYLQWATGKGIMNEYLRTGSGTPPRNSPYQQADIVKASPFPQEWFDTTLKCLSIARSGLPEIVPVTEFRDALGVGLTNIIGGGDIVAELKKATEGFQPVLDKENAS